MIRQYSDTNPWKIIENSFDAKRVKSSESIFSIGNGYMGQRANFEEDYSGETFQGSYIGGVYYPDKTKVGWWKNGYPEYLAKVLNAPNWIGIHIKVNKETLDLNKITTESIKQSRPLWKDEMEKTGLKININTDFGKISNIIFNKGALSSIIYNLIKNSIEAMPEGGEITIKTGIKTEGVFLTCTDSGIGMDQETKLKIFQPFYTTKGYKTGRGLGMSGVYSVVKEAGGSVKVKNTIIGKGTTIEIVLPANKLKEIKDKITIKQKLK